MHRIVRNRIALSGLVLSGIAGATANGQEPAPRALTLDQAIATARESNAGVRAVRQRVEEAERQNRVVFSNYLPRLSTQAAFLGSDNTRGILVPAGALGNVPGLGSFPAASTSIPQGGSNIVFAFTSAQQPLTQFFKIREGLGVTRADESIARADLYRTEQAVSIGVLKAYAGLLIASKRRDVARARIATATMRTTTQTTAVQAGIATSVATTEAKLRALQARQDLLEAENEYTDLSYALADAVGLPGNTPLSVDAPPPAPARTDSVDAYLASATQSNPDILEADATVVKATHGVGAARTSYIPDIGLFGGHFYQSSFPFLPHSTLMFGAVGSLTIFDFGARSNTLAERQAQLTAANANLERVTSKVRGDVQAAYRKLARAFEMVDVAREALALRTEALRLRVVQTGAGYGVPQDESEASADQLDAELNVLKAEMGYRIACAELDQAAGRLSR
ncbi:MAG: TolC family protein [Gemmatimonadaceae bacterium]